MFILVGQEKNSSNCLGKSLKIKAMADVMCCKVCMISKHTKMFSKFTFERMKFSFAKVNNGTLSNSDSTVRLHMKTNMFWRFQKTLKCYLRTNSAAVVRHTCCTTQTPRLFTRTSNCLSGLPLKRTLLNLAIKVWGRAAPTRLSFRALRISSSHISDWQVKYPMNSMCLEDVSQ